MGNLEDRLWQLRHWKECSSNSEMCPVHGRNMQEFLFIWGGGGGGWSIHWTIQHPPRWIETACGFTPVVQLAVKFVLMCHVLQWSHNGNFVIFFRLDESRGWVNRIRGSGGCNLLAALKKIFKTKDVDSIVVVLGSWSVLYIIQIMTNTVMKYHVLVDCQESYVSPKFAALRENIAMRGSITILAPPTHDISSVPFNICY